MRTIDSNEFEYTRRKYQGSLSEESAIIREFVFGKGSITHLFNVIPFMRLEDQDRVVLIIKRCIELGKIPKMSIKKIRH